MTRNALYTFVFTLISTSLFAAQGGPDAYGYVWQDSNEPGGPTYNWVDISGTGNLVSGLADDNSVPFISMGMSFHYYWADYTELKIGSNGWISFNNTGNIAHCFPTMPVPAGPSDNYLAPLMTDLTFTGVGNPAKVYYQLDVPNDRFIISYIDVPWWSVNAPDYVGINSFQVILSNADSSITYQYKDSDAANFLDNATCASDVVIGIEGPTGSNGLQVLQDVVPPSAYAVKFSYPNPVLIQIADVTPEWNVNLGSKGEFYYMDQQIDIAVNVKSVGNADVTMDITVNGIVEDSVGGSVATFQTIITGGLPAGMDTTIWFQWTPTETGQYGFRTATVNSEDINSSNNIQAAELEILDANALGARMSYVNESDVSTGVISWSSGAGDGVGVYMVPASYPYQLDSMGVFLVGGGDDVTLEVYADDGINNAPGTLLHSETLAAAGITFNAWIRSAMVSPITFNSGGFYLVWIQEGTVNSIGTVNSGPLSRQNLEYLGGWAEFRYNQVEDFMLEAHGFSVCATLTSTATSTDELLGNDGSINLTVTGGVPPYSFNWTNGGGIVEDPSSLSSGLYTVTITDSAGCVSTQNVTVNSQVGLVEATATSNWNVYPNPSNEKITVELNNFGNEFVELKILDVIGRVVHNSRVEASQEVNISKAGLYYVVLSSEDRFEIKQVIIK
ncbi:MAG: hypothetical protein ACJASQ_003402 [Crocinitomicaceae bacterium]|jgi:hypothetical protein